MAHDTHDHSREPETFNRAFGVGIALNVGFVAIEAFYGWRVDSLALLADAGHNLSDVAGLALAWVAAAAGRLTPDHRHTYGWRRASIMAALANAILLLVAMGSLAWEAVGRLGSPVATSGLTIVAVAAVGTVVNGATAALFMSGRAMDLNIRGAFMHMAADALVSLGVVAAGVLYLWTGWNWLDPVASLAIAVLIVAGTLGLFRQSLHLMFDGVPDAIDLHAVETFLSSRPGVEEVHDLHVWAMSTSEVALTAHLVMPDGHPGNAFLDAIAHSLRDRYGVSHATIQIERDPMDPGCVRSPTGAS